jgi:hypothetical protein
MTGDRMVKKLYDCKPLSTRLAGRPKSRWKNNIKGDIRTVKINNWTKRIQDQV